MRNASRMPAYVPGTDIKSRRLSRIKIRYIMIMEDNINNERTIRTFLMLSTLSEPEIMIISIAMDSPISRNIKSSAEIAVAATLFQRTLINLIFPSMTKV